MTDPAAVFADAPFALCSNIACPAHAEPDQHPKVHVLNLQYHVDCLPPQLVPSYVDTHHYGQEAIDAAKRGVHGADLSALILQRRAEYAAANPTVED